MDTTTKYKYLAPRRGSSYRQLFVKGRGIAARTLYGQHVNAEEPRTIEHLAEDFDLSVEVVREAIAYCESNSAEIRVDWLEDELMIELSGMNEPGFRTHPRPRPLTWAERAFIDAIISLARPIR